jgi:hypothetical protein
LAFPDGIPDQILSGQNEHSKSLKGQRNKIVFEPIKAASDWHLVNSKVTKNLIADSRLSDFLFREWDTLGYPTKYTRLSQTESEFKMNGSRCGWSGFRCF